MVMNSDNSLNIWDLNKKRLLRYGLEQTQNVKKIMRSIGKEVRAANTEQKLEARDSCFST